MDTFSEGSTYLSIRQSGGSWVNFKTIIETIDIPDGEKGFDSMASISGGRLKKHNPQEDVEVTLEGYAIEVGDGNGFYDLVQAGTADTTQPLSFNPDHNHTEFDMVILATDNNQQGSADLVTTTGDKAMRWHMVNGHFTKCDASFTDNVWKFTIAFKVTPFNRVGSANITYESTDGEAGDVLPAIA